MKLKSKRKVGEGDVKVDVYIYVLRLLHVSIIAYILDR